MGYDILIYLDPENADAAEDIRQILSNMDYGYELVSCSRILENPEAKPSRRAYLHNGKYASSIREVTDLDITDPLSGILAISASALNNMELTDYTHAFFFSSGSSGLPQAGFHRNSGINRRELRQGAGSL
jgi:hypothetical protein